MESPVSGGLLFVNGVVLVEFRDGGALSLEATFVPEASEFAISFADSSRSVVVQHSSEVSVVSVSNKEVVNKRGDAMQEGISFSHSVLVSRSLDHSEHLFSGVMFVSIFITLEHESARHSVVKAVGYSSGNISLVDGSEFTVGMESVNDASTVNTVFHVGEHVRGVRSKDNIGGQETHVGVSLKGSKLSVSSEFNKAFVLIFRVGEVMLDRVAGSEVFNSLFLGKFGGSDEEVVLVGGHSNIIVREVDAMFSTFHGKGQIRSVSSLSLLHGDSVGCELSLEGVDRSSVGSKVKHSNLGVLARGSEVADNTL